MPEPSPIEVHKALADGTRYRLYRYLRLSGRPVSVRELAMRLSLHVNTLRPHLRRLEDAGLVTQRVTTRRAHRWGGPRPCTRSSTEMNAKVATTGCSPTSSPASSRVRVNASERSRRAREWGAYLVGRAVPRPGARGATGPNLAVLQEALAEAGFDPRFRRRGACSGRHHACATVRSGTFSTSIESWCVRSTGGCSKACSRAPAPRCASTRSSRSPIDLPSAACPRFAPDAGPTQARPGVRTRTEVGADPVRC